MKRAPQTYPVKGEGQHGPQSPLAPATTTCQGRSPLSSSPGPPLFKPSRGQRARGPDDEAQRGQPPGAHHRAEEVSEWSGVPRRVLAAPASSVLSDEHCRMMGAEASSRVGPTGSCPVRAL